MISPLHVVSSLWGRRALIYEMTRRDITGRYRGSLLGIFWSMLQPMLMLAIYTFVFTQVFRARWHGAGSGSEIDFALNLFAGLIVFNVFAECANRAPGAILAHANFVTRVVFPLEIIPLVQLGASLFHATLSLAILVLAQWVAKGFVPPSLVLTPLVFVPLSLLAIGTGWLLAATGVYWRDIGQLTGLVVTGLLFVSPVFFPADALPERWRFIAAANPLTYPIEFLRAVAIQGSVPQWQGGLLHSALSALWAWFGYCCFQRLRKGFADVL